MLVRWRRRERPNANGSHSQFTSLYIFTTYKFKWQVARGKYSRYAVLDPGIIGHNILYNQVLCPESSMTLPESRHVLNLPFEFAREWRFSHMALRINELC